MIPDEWRHAINMTHTNRLTPFLCKYYLDSKPDCLEVSTTVYLSLIRDCVTGSGRYCECNPCYLKCFAFRVWWATKITNHSMLEIHWPKYISNSKAGWETFYNVPHLETNWYCKVGIFSVDYPKICIYTQQPWNTHKDIVLSVRRSCKKSWLWKSDIAGLASWTGLSIAFLRKCVSNDANG